MILNSSAESKMQIFCEFFRCDSSESMDCAIDSPSLAEFKSTSPPSLAEGVRGWVESLFENCALLLF